VNCPPFLIGLSFWVELVGACNSIPSNGNIIILYSADGSMHSKMETSENNKGPCCPSDEESSVTRSVMIRGTLKTAVDGF
jgi:hypothetical protein